MTDPTPADPAAQGEGDPRPMPTSQPVLVRALRWGLILTVALMAVFALVGWLVSEQRGLVGGIIGTGIGGVLCLLTVGSIAFANRFVESDLYIPAFFGIVLGSWIVKLIAFIVAIILLRDQAWLDPKLFFFGLLAGVLGSLLLDVLVVAKSRIPVMAGVG